MTLRQLASVLLGLLSLANAAQAQSAGSGPAPPPNPPAVSAPVDPDLTLAPSEPDFTLVSLPTSLRLPRHKFAFRLTHRFTHAVGDGSVGDFFANFFEFDSSARIGLEVRFGLRSGTQLVFHRTSERGMQLLLQQELVGQRAGRPLTIDALAAFDGLNNFSQAHGGSLGIVAGHRLGNQAALYVEPIVTFNSTTDRFAPVGQDLTAMIALGARVRLGGSRSYLVAEAAPRLSGDRPGVNHVSFGFERRVGGHVFQLNLSNSLATTLRELAHGGPGASAWYIGFNLSRKFY